MSEIDIMCHFSDSGVLLFVHTISSVGIIVEMYLITKNY